MNNKITWNHITLWGTILTVVVVFSQEANGILTDSNDLDCTHIQCPTKCPVDSYLQSAAEDDEEDFEDYEDQSYLEQIGNFEELPPEEELHDTHSPQHILKERQKREVFFQEDIERCCDDQKCVCNKCEDVPKCPVGQMAVEVHEGQGIPGNCCSVFRCIQKQVCRLGLKQSWWTSKCTRCSCFGESELCLQICQEEEVLQNCYSEYWQKPMMNGAFWKEGRCTTCSCERGERRCIIPQCPKLDCEKTIALEDECCPKCVNEETTANSEMLPIKPQNITNSGDEYPTGTPTEDVTLSSLNEETSSATNEIHSSSLNKIQTSAPITQTIESSTASAMPNIFGDISSTFQPESNQFFQQNVSSTTSTPDLHTSSPSSLLNTSTSEKVDESLLVGQTKTTRKEPEAVIETTSYSPIEKPISKKVFEQDNTSTAAVTVTEMDELSSTAATETSHDSMAEDTTIKEIVLKNTTEESFTRTSSTFMEETFYSHESSTLTTPNILEFPTSTHRDISSEVLSANTTTSTPSIIFETSASTAITEEITTSNETFSSTKPLITNTPLDLTKQTSTTTNVPELESSTTKYSASLFNSTTSSPFSSTADSTTTTIKTTSIELQSILPSSTSAPETLKPLLTSYGDLDPNQRISSTQNQMRIVFDEIDYVVMIVLFIGSLLCISLGLIIRHSKNRKKMYSSIPNSETSLSQTSTNTVLTV